MNTRGPDAPRVSAMAVNAHANSACPREQESRPLSTIVNHINGARQLLKLVPAMCDGEHNQAALVRAAERNLHTAVRLLVEPPLTLELEEVHAQRMATLGANVLRPRCGNRFQEPFLEVWRFESWSVTPAGAAVLREDPDQVPLALEVEA